MGQNKAIPELELIDENTIFTLKEICIICSVRPDYLVEMVEYGILEPVGTQLNEWRFSAHQLMRFKKAMRIQHDLEVNLPGTVLAIDLLDEIESLRNRLNQAELLLTKLCEEK